MNEEEEQRIIQPGQRARPQPQPLDSQESGPPALPPFITPTVREQPAPRARGGMGRARQTPSARRPTEAERMSAFIQDLDRASSQAEQDLAFFNKARTRAILDEVEARASDPTQKDGATYTEDVFLPRKLAALKEMADSGASPDDIMAWAKKELPAPYRPTDWDHKRRVWEQVTVEGNYARLKNKAMDYLQRLYGMSAQAADEKTSTADSAAQVIFDTENALERYAADNSISLGAESAVRGFMGPAIVKAWESLGDLTTPQAQMKAREVQKAFMQEALMYRQKRLSDAGWTGTIEEILADVLPALPRQLGAQIVGSLVGGTLGGGAAMGLMSAADAKVLGAPQHQIRREALKGTVLGVFGSLGEHGVIAASMKLKGNMPSLMARFLGVGAVSVASEYGVAKATGEEYTLKDAVSSFLLEGAFSAAETSPQAQRHAAWKAYSSGEEAKILDNRAASAAKMIEQAAGRPLTEEEFFGFYDAQSKVKSGRFRAEIMGNLASQIANERVAQQEAARRLEDARVKFKAAKEQRLQAERRGFGSLDEEAAANIGMQEGVPLEAGGTAPPMSEEELSQRMAAGAEQFETEAAPAREAARQERARQLRAERGTEGPEYRAAEYRKALEEQFRAEREDERRMLDEAKKARVSAKAQQTLERMVDRAARLREQMLEAAGFEGEALPPPTTPPAPAVTGEAAREGAPPSGVTEADVEARMAGEGEPSGWVPPQGAGDLETTPTPTAPQAEAPPAAPPSAAAPPIPTPAPARGVGGAARQKSAAGKPIVAPSRTKRNTYELRLETLDENGEISDVTSVDSVDDALDYIRNNPDQKYSLALVKGYLDEFGGQEAGTTDTYAYLTDDLSGFKDSEFDDGTPLPKNMVNALNARKAASAATPPPARGMGGARRGKKAAPPAAPAAEVAAAEGRGKYDLMKDGIEGEAIDYRRVQNGNEYFEYAIGRVEEGAPLEVFRRSISNRGSYGGWRWETDVSKLKPAAQAEAAPAAQAAPAGRGMSQTQLLELQARREQLLARKAKMDAIRAQVDAMPVPKDAKVPEAEWRSEEVRKLAFRQGVMAFSRIDTDLADIEARLRGERPATPEGGERMSVGKAGGGKKMASYFSGARTLEAGLGDVAQPVMAVEFDPEINAWANAVAGTSYPTRSVLDIDPAEIKALGLEHFHASPVCKNVSLAKIAGKVDELDMKSAEAVARVIREADVPVVTIENVPKYVGSIPHKIITDALTEAGYKHETVIVDAADYGGSSMRARMITRAVKRGDLPALPPKTGPADWYETVKDLIPGAPADSPRGKGGGEFWEYGRLAQQSLLPKDRESYIDLDKPIYMAGGSTGKTVAYARNAGGPAPTVTSTEAAIPRILIPDANGPEVIRVPDGKGGFTEKRFIVKRVTGRMMARLMGLPDSFRIPDDPGLAKKVIGNGMHTATTQAVIKPLLERLTDGERMSVGKADVKTEVDTGPISPGGRNILNRFFDYHDGSPHHVSSELSDAMLGFGGYAEKYGVRDDDPAGRRRSEQKYKEEVRRALKNNEPVSRWADSFAHIPDNYVLIKSVDENNQRDGFYVPISRPLAPNTPEFKKAFGESYVAYEDGTPILMFHGTNAEPFLEFDAGKRSSKSVNGAMFTPRSYEADTYSLPEDLALKNARTIPAYLRVENPMWISRKDVEAKVWNAKGSVRQAWNMIIADAKFNGHDGIIVESPDAGDKPLRGAGWVITFDPSQIIPAFAPPSARGVEFMSVGRGDGTAPPGGMEEGTPPGDPGLQSARAWAEQNLVPHLRAKPKSLRERFGPNPTPEQRAQHRREMLAWRRGAADLRGQLVDKIINNQAEAETVDTVRTGTRVDQLAQDLKSGKITQEEFNRRVSEQMDAEMARREVDRARKATGTRIRGRERVMEVLYAASRKGEISPEMVDIADWLLSQNPELADTLALRVIERRGKYEKNGVEGVYNTGERLVTLFKGIGESLTVAHEILHHLERFMPAPMRAAIRAEYLAQLDKAVKAANVDLVKASKANDEEAITKASNLILFLNNISEYHRGGKASLLEDAVGMITDGSVEQAMYRLTQPSEFWAENGSRILKSRFEAKDRGIWARIRQWMTEFAQKVKSVFGARSDAPVIKAMDYILKQSGAVETTSYGLGGRARTGDIYASGARAQQQGRGTERFSVAAGGVPPEAGGGDRPVEGGEAPEGPGPGEGLGRRQEGWKRSEVRDFLGESGGSLRGKAQGMGDMLYEKIKMAVARGREIRGTFSDTANKVISNVMGTRAERAGEQAVERDGFFYYRWNALIKGWEEPKNKGEELMRDTAHQTLAQTWNEGSKRLGVRMGRDGPELMSQIGRGRTPPHDFSDYILDVFSDPEHPDRQVVAQYMADATNAAIKRGEIPAPKAKVVDGKVDDGMRTVEQAEAYMAKVANSLSPLKPTTGAEGHLASEVTRDWIIPDMIPANMVSSAARRRYGAKGFVPLQKPLLGLRLMSVIDNTSRIIGAQVEFGRGKTDWTDFLPAAQKTSLMLGEEAKGELNKVALSWISQNMGELIGKNVLPALRDEYVKKSGGLIDAGVEFDQAMRTAFGRPFFGGSGRHPMTTARGKMGAAYDLAATVVRGLDLTASAVLNTVELFLGAPTFDSVQGAPPGLNIPLGFLTAMKALPGSVADALGDILGSGPWTGTGRDLLKQGRLAPYIATRGSSRFDSTWVKGIRNLHSALAFPNTLVNRIQSYQAARTLPFEGKMADFIAKWSGKNGYNQEVMAHTVAQRAGVTLEEARMWLEGDPNISPDRAEQIWKMAQTRAVSILSGEGIAPSESSAFIQQDAVRRLFTFWRWHDSYVRRNFAQLKSGLSGMATKNPLRGAASAARFSSTLVGITANAVAAKLAYMFVFMSDEDREKEMEAYRENPAQYISDLGLTQLLAGPLGTIVRMAGESVVSTGAFLPGRIIKKGDALLDMILGVVKQVAGDPEGKAQLMKGLENFWPAAKIVSKGEGSKDYAEIQRRESRPPAGLGRGMPPMPGFGPR